MFRPVIGVLALLILASSCKKEEAKQYKVSLRATCFDCLVQYASGPDRGRYDTLAGFVEGTDTIRETGTYELVMKQDEALFFRACRIWPDSGSFGDIELSAEGDIEPIYHAVPAQEVCGVINREVQFR